jgi:hypothetical protein
MLMILGLLDSLLKLMHRRLGLLLAGISLDVENGPDAHGTGRLRGRLRHDNDARRLLYPS